MNVVSFTPPTRQRPALVLRESIDRLRWVAGEFDLYRESMKPRRVLADGCIEDLPAGYVEDETARHKIDILLAVATLGFSDLCVVGDIVEPRHRNCFDVALIKVLKWQMSAADQAAFASRLLRLASAADRSGDDRTAAGHAARVDVVLGELDYADSALIMKLIGTVVEARRGPTTSFRAALRQLALRFLSPQDLGRLVVRFVDDMTPAVGEGIATTRGGR